MSLPACCAIAALALLGLAGGWLILFSGGFHKQLGRYTGETIFVSGLPALLMAALMFSLAFVGALVLVRVRSTSILAQTLVCAAVLGPPVCFVLAG